MPRIVADRGRCIGAGQCVLTAPRLFEQDGEGLVILLSDPDPTESSELLAEAVGLCPSEAIRLIVP